MEVCWWRQSHPKQDVGSFGEPAKGKTKGAHSRDRGQPQKILAQFAGNAGSEYLILNPFLALYNLALYNHAIETCDLTIEIFEKSIETCDSRLVNGIDSMVIKWKLQQLFSKRETVAARRNWVKIQWCRVFQFVETSGENKYDKRPGLNLHSCPSSSFYVCL